MYVPRFNAMDDADEIRALVASVGAAELVTVAPDGFPAATLLPVIWDGDRLVFHMARANPQWRSIRPGDPALAVVTGPQAYVSPAWYASKAEHGRVVPTWNYESVHLTGRVTVQGPTWNYESVHLTGRVTVHDDAGWLRDAVAWLTDLHEDRRDDRWSVTDAPERYVDKQVRAIVGVELALERVEAKAKLSQNRSDEDRAGVVDGLRREGGGREHEVADRMERVRRTTPPG